MAFVYMKFNKLRLSIGFFGASAVLFLLTFLLSYWAHLPLNLPHYASQINQDLRKVEQSADSTLRNRSLLREFLLHSEEHISLKSMEQKPYAIYLYRGDSLKFWSTNKILPNASEIALPESRQVGFYDRSGRRQGFRRRALLRSPRRGRRARGHSHRRCVDLRPAWHRRRP